MGHPADTQPRRSDGKFSETRRAEDTAVALVVAPSTEAATAHRYERAEAESENLQEVVEDLASIHEDVDTRPFDEALETAWDNFDQADGTHQAMLDYADAIETAGAQAWKSIEAAGYNADWGPEEHRPGRPSDVRFEQHVAKINADLKVIADRLRTAADSEAEPA